MPFPSLSPVDSFTPAIQRTTALLFKPFRWSFYWRMAVVAFLTGELGGIKGNFNIPSNFPTGGGRQRGGSSEFLSSIPWHLPTLNTIDWIIIGAIAFVAFFAVLLIFLYIASIFRFILFDAVLTGNCSIRESWSRRQSEGRKYFQWSLIVMAISFSIGIVIFGTPVLFAWSSGIFQNARQHILLLVLGGTVMLFLLLAFLLVAGAVHIISRDMLVPMFAFENVSIGEAWERVKQLVAADKGGYAGYYGMCILLAIGVGIVFGIIGFILLLILLIPMVLIGVVVFGIIAATGWNPVAIILAVLLGLVALVAIMFVSALIYVPAVIFRQSYGMYFFGARYRQLMPYMYPPPPPLPPPFVPPAEPAPA
jgi:hypothetical protein